MSECLPATLKHRIEVLGTNGNLLSVDAACEHNRLTVQGLVCSRTVDTGHATAGAPSDLMLIRRSRFDDDFTPPPPLTTAFGP
jgi:hypothetical protein